MDYHSKEGTVYMAQVDHLTGEQIGYAVGRFYDAGASNVQVLSSLTKKGRPSYVIFIDCRQEFSEDVEALIPSELGSGGWHKIITEHHYLYSSIAERSVVAEHGGRYEEFAVKGKLFENGNLRPEHDSVIDLQEALHERFGIYKGYSEIYRFIDRCISTDEGEPLVWHI